MAFQMERGARELQPDLRHHTADVILAQRMALFDATTQYNNSRLDLRNCRDQLEALTTTTQDFVTGTRDTMKLRLGKRYSVRWVETGFDGTLEGPRTPQELIPLVQTLGVFLANNPSFEVSQLNITAARAAELHTALENAYAGVSRQKVICTQLLEARDEKARTLRKKIRGMINELEFLMEDNDPRWTAFGLNVPAAVQRPETPENVEVKIVENKDAYIQWEAPARAERYHIFQKIVGVDAEPVNVGTSYDPNFVSEDLPATSTVEITIVALNDGGASAPSAVVRVKLE